MKRVSKTPTPSRDRKGAAVKSPDKPQPSEAENKALERLHPLAASLRYAAKHPSKAESIHDLRVAIRRFTQVLSVFDGAFDHPRRMRRRLRSLLDLCGEARNCDVALEVLEAAGVPAGHGLKKRLNQRRARAGRELARQIEDWHVRSHMRRWREWLAAKGEPPRASQVLPRLAREFSQEGAAAAKAEAGFRQMHKFRLLVKRYRYTAEILGETAGPPLDVLKGLQEHLGAINDCVATAELIDDMKLSVAERRKAKAAVNRLLARRSVDFRTYWRKSRRTK